MYPNFLIESSAQQIEKKKVYRNQSTLNIKLPMLTCGPAPPPLAHNRRAVAEPAQ